MSAEGVTFFDRTGLDNVSALEQMGLSEDRHYEAIRDLVYADPIFFAPPWPEIFVNDKERRHGFEAALREAGALRHFYALRGYDVVDLPKTTVSERADFVIARIERET